MCSNKPVLLLLMICALVVCKAEFEYDELQLEGSCPRIRFITNLEMPRIIGWYYRVFSNLNYPSCYNNQAQTMFAAQWNATAINVAFCCQSAADPTVTACGSDVGSGVVAGLAPGVFTYTVNDDVYPNFILDTDYDNFTIVYGCKPGTPAYNRDETIFIYSRSYTLSESLQARVRRVLAANNIRWSDARRVVQGPNLPYLPLPSQC